MQRAGDVRPHLESEIRLMSRCDSGETRARASRQKEKRRANWKHW
jgi:hypothetical protein